MLGLLTLAGWQGPGAEFVGKINDTAEVGFVRAHLSTAAGAGRNFTASSLLLRRSSRACHSAAAAAAAAGSCKIG